METAIGRAIKSSGMTQEAVADRMGVSRQAVTSWAPLGKTPTYKNLLKLADILGCSVSALTGEEPMTTYRAAEGDSVADGYVRVPVLSASASCGGPDVQNNEVDIVGAIDFRAPFLKTLPGVTGLSNLHIVHVHGDSMEPTIPARSLCLIDGNQKAIRGDGIYCLGAHGDTYIKRIQKNLDGSLTLLSDNPVYPPQTLVLNENDFVVIEGRVVLVLKTQIF